MTDAAQDHSQPSEQQLWSWVDRDAPELAEHLVAHPEDAPRVARLREAIGRFESVDEAAAMPESIDGYRIMGILGRGGMGCVYDAEQAEPRRPVALKVLPPEFAADDRRLTLFRREANALARLSHPGIARIFGVGREPGGSPYIAMERIEGHTLLEHVEATGLGHRARLVMAHRIAEAVGHAHDRGVLHRDLKPTNVLVREDGTPVVVDFGLARIDDEELTRASLATRSGSLMGTLIYMSPEQVGGSVELEPTSDVYGLGVLLYQLLVGRLPYDLAGLSLVDAARCIQTTRPRIKLSDKRSLRGDLGLVLLKALEKTPARRYATAGELAAELQRVLDGRPVEASRPTLTGRTLRFVARHKLASVAAALVLFLGLSLALVLVFPMRFPIPMIGNWWGQGVPYEDLRWLRDSPEVLVDGEWYALVAIDDLRSAYLVGFCQQNSERNWRKRFSEDLMQVLNRQGNLGIGGVDLTLRDLETGELMLREDVPLNEAWRDGIRNKRNDWPWSEEPGVTGSHGVRYEDRVWELLEVDGMPIARFPRFFEYDDYCDVVGRSPGTTVDFVLRDPVTGDLRRVEGAPRDPKEGSP